MKKIIVIIAAIIGIIWYFWGCCGTGRLVYHADKKPILDLRKFFDGEMEGWGIFFDYKGRQKSTFIITLKGAWVENKGKLDESFIFDDGRKLERVWDLEFKEGQLFTGAASDVPGGATGMQMGNAANIDYMLRVPYNHSTIDLKMDDWMYMIDDNTILNRTAMRKFGFKVGEMVLFMRKK